MESDEVARPQSGGLPEAQAGQGAPWFGLVRRGVLKRDGEVQRQRQGTETQMKSLTYNDGLLCPKKVDGFVSLGQCFPTFSMSCTQRKLECGVAHCGEEGGHLPPQAQPAPAELGRPASQHPRNPLTGWEVLTKGRLPSLSFVIVP